MSTPPVISPAEARGIVETIAKEYGWISPTAREQSHQEALDAIERLQIGLGAAARTLAQNLYRSNARFLFELIQNAEDNHYSRAKTLGVEPFIKFTIRPNTIVIDCNEDGFTPENVRAICRIGESTKIRANAQYYIGEKGIGFKSVFMVASKVHIQSGPFSFFFEHEPGNNGMGMITPVWESSDITLDEPLTRITLTLLESLDLDDLLLQFDDFPHTLLLFLNKMGKIIIDEDVQEERDIQEDAEIEGDEDAVSGEEEQEHNDEDDYEDEADEESEADEEAEDEGDDEESQDDGDDEDEQEAKPKIRKRCITTYSCEFDQNIGRARVTVLKHRARRPFFDSDEYRIVRKALSNLPTDGQRDYNTAEVTLAFPVYELQGVDRPLIAPQQVYAYLPIRDFGFPFIIHSDFITQASREDVMENARNTAILEGVAEVFVDAVIQFSQHPVLQYRWMHYIPEDDQVSSPFWSRLLIRIKERIKAAPILWPRSRTGLRLISQLRILPNKFQDSHGEPLVADLPERNQEMYLDPKYGQKAHNAHSKLKTLGLAVMRTKDFIERFGRDANSLSTRMKSADDDWHERVAHILLAVLEGHHRKRKTYVRSLPLIPLGDHHWASTTDGDMYFPDTDGMPIPSDLKIKLVDPKAAANATRKQLFVGLGVTDANAQLVRSLIMEKHKKSWDKITLEFSVKHLHYLYWTQTRDFDNFGLHKSVPFCLFNHQNVTVDGNHDLYFQRDDKYGIQEFLVPALKENPGSEEFGSFINNKYFESPPPQKYSLIFTIWVESMVGVLSAPRIQDPNHPSELSKIFRYIIINHPEKLLGTLKAHWSYYNCGTSPDMNSGITEKLSQVLIPCTNAGWQELRETFLPLKELETHCSQFVNPQIFPFLTLGGATSVEAWKFLKILGVGVELNLDFYLEILLLLEESETSSPYRIYEEMQKKIWANSTSTDLKRVQDVIRDDCLLCTPTTHDGNHWISSIQCVWDGPSYLTVKYPLLPNLRDGNNPTLTAFFVDTLEISSVSYRDLLNELASMQKSSDTMPRSTKETENIRDIYTRLQAMSSSLSPLQFEDVRNSFEEDGLVYDAHRPAWVSTSSCLWSKDAQIPGKVTILRQYGDLKDFFVGTLKVKIPDLGLLVDELSRVGSAHLSVDDVKSLIWQINSFSPSRKALEKLKTLPIFPVQAAGTGLDSAVLRVKNEKFSIIDRQPWAQAFEGKIDILDFKLEEARRLQPFLSCFELENRYLSRVVREISSFQGENEEQSRTRTRQLRSRAHALARCAAHFGSPRICDDNQFIYQLLLQGEVYETDGIVTNLVHTQCSETVTIEVDRRKLHIAEDSKTLKIYVPKGRKDQELCFLQHLPTKLFNQVIMGYKTGNSTLASDSEAVRIAAALFNSSDEVVCDLLDDAGIIPVPYPDGFDIRAYEQSTTESTPQHAEHSPVNSQVGSHSSTREERRESPEQTSSPGSRLLSSTPLSSSYRTNYRGATPTYHQPSLSSFSSRPSTPLSDEPVPFSVNSGQREYRRLINNVIAAAKSKKGGFPTRGAFNLDVLLNALPIDSDAGPISYDLPFGVRSENQLAHDMKVGAAGELYVFEILSRLGTRLPGFGRGNWQSTIRRYVKVHEDYDDMEAWNGAETADITYDDKDGELTKLLVENMYLDDIWIGATPKYYLEVKTTTKECGTRFFVSKSQYQRMERMRLTKGLASSEVYIILRVFNLGKETIDMRVYVDPKGIEEGGDLIFTPESYSVLPAGSTCT